MRNGFPRGCPLLRLFIVADDPNAHETNDIQYENCKRLLSEEKNKTLNEVLKACDIECGLYSGDVKNLTRHVLMRVLDGLRE